MKRLATLMLLIVSPLGCKDTSKPTDEEKAKIVPSGKGNLSVEGGGGATQAVRKAAARTVNDHNMDQLRTFIAAMMTDESVPSAAEIVAATRGEKSLAKLISDEIVILTDTKMQNGIWAYSKWPQRAGKHYVIKLGGRDEMTPEELETALKSQGSVVKLEK